MIDPETTNIEEYNILEGLNGLGTDIFLEVAKSMTAPKDVQTLCLLSKNTSKLLTHKYSDIAYTGVSSYLLATSVLPSKDQPTVCF